MQRHEVTHLASGQQTQKQRQINFLKNKASSQGLIIRHQVLQYRYLVFFPLHYQLFQNQSILANKSILIYVLVFKGCYNKLPLLWLKTIEICVLTVLEASKSKIKVSVEPCLLCRLQGKILPCLFPVWGGSQPSWVFLGLQLHHSSLCLPLHVVFVSLGICLCIFSPSSSDTNHWIWGPPNPVSCKVPISK